MFEVLEHTADVGIRATGPTIREAFEETARGMFSIIGDHGDLEGTVEIEMSAEGHDLESLLHGILSELLYVHEVEGVLPTGLHLSLEGKKAKGVVHGCPNSLVSIFTEIKAVTYHRLRVEETDDGWVCEVLFDI